MTLPLAELDLNTDDSVGGTSFNEKVEQDEAL